jgi:hypothetical protein
MKKDVFFIPLDSEVISDKAAVAIPVIGITAVVVAGILVIYWQVTEQERREALRIPINWETDTIDSVVNQVLAGINQSGFSILSGGFHDSIRSGVESVFAARRGNTPENNSDQNKQFNDAVKAVERLRGKPLSEEERNAFHKAVSGQGYGFWEMVITGVDMFCPEALNRIPRDKVPEGWEWW